MGFSIPFPKAYAPIACQQCANGRKKIYLQISASDTLDTWQGRSVGHFTHALDYQDYETEYLIKQVHARRAAKGDPSKFKREPAPQKRHITVSSMDDFYNGITKLIKDCYQIEGISIDSHGAEGLLGFGDDIITAAHIEKLKGASCAMSPGAEIKINSCNTGKGCSGENFLRAWASSFLQNGGKVYANTHYSIGIAGLPIKQKSINFDRQILTVEKGLQNSKWDNDAKNCPDIYKDKLERIHSLKKKLAENPNCKFKGKYYLIENLERARGMIEPLLAAYKKTGWSRSSIAPVDNFEEFDTSGIDKYWDEIEKNETNVSLCEFGKKARTEPSTFRFPKAQ